MTRCGVRATVLLLALLAQAGTARADCFDWSEPGLTVETGTLAGLPPGAIRWRTGRNRAGGQHWRTQVELRWTGPDGRERHQALFAAIQDGRPVLAARRGRLALRVTYCPTGEDCRDQLLPYRWDRVAARFAGASAAARRSLAEACDAEGAAGP